MSDTETVIPLDPDNRLFEQVQVFWYDHSCDWLTKYCDENHRKSTFVPRWTLERGQAPMDAAP
jgi:hypothetical protein